MWNPAGSRGPAAGLVRRALRPNGAAVATLLLLAAAACSGSSHEADTVPAPPYAAPVQFDTGEENRPLLYVEIADTPEERARGLMGRESLPEDAGMLFVWPQDTESGFWMKDTPTPLTIAFVDAAGAIVDIEDMAPLDETLHYSAAPYRYAIEAAQGWFADKGIEVGDRIILPEGVSKARTGQEAPLPERGTGARRG